jgi:esterase/lipase superfamily enzyme
MSEAEFWRMVNSELARSESKEPQALVYLHGYNVSFEDAAIRSAQIGFDLKSTAVTGFFSWPSKATFEGYPADEATIEASEAAITEFLVRFAQEVGAERVHVVAHSMGNRGLLRAMQRIERNAEHLSGIKFGQIFLAAPDVDAELFCELAEAYPRFGRRTTLYSSPSDKAVGLSAWFHGAPRAGFTPPVTIVPGIDTVHVPDFDLDVLGHGYYAAAAGILSDMFDLIHRNSPPSGRQRLTEEMREDRSSYWEMRK